MNTLKTTWIFFFFTLISCIVIVTNSVHAMDFHSKEKGVEGTDHAGYISEYLENKNLFEENRKSDITKAKSHLNAAIEIAKREGYSKELAQLYYEGALLMMKASASLEEASAMSNLCLEYSTEKDSFFYMCKALLGRIAIKNGNYTTAEVYFNEAVRKAEEVNNKAFLYKVYLDIGLDYYWKNQLESSMNCYLESLKYSNQLNDSLLIAKAYKRISSIHFRLQDHDKTLEYIKKGASFVRDTNSLAYLRFLLNEATVLQDQNKDQEAIVKYHNLLKNKLVERDSLLKRDIYYNLALIHFYLEDFTSTYSYLDLMKLHNNDDYFNFNYHIVRARIFYKNQKCHSAKKEVRLAKNFINGVYDYNDVYGFYRTKTAVKICLAETDSILSLIDSVVIYADSASYEYNKNEALLLESEYFSRTQRDSILLLQAQKERQQDSNQKKNIILFLLFILSAAASLGVYLYRKYYFKFKKLNLILEETNIERIKLFTNLAHELKTPLSLITGLSDLIKKEGNLSSSTLDKVDKINNSSKKLLKSSTQLLEIAQDNFAGENSDLSPILLSEVLDNLKIDFESQIAHKKQILEIENTFASNFVMNTDSEKFSTILTNLLDNAVKYTNIEGFIQLKLEKGEQENILLTISNTGQGISKEDLPYLFDRHFRSKKNSDAGGFGIGLSIVKEYVNLLNGKIRVESTPGKLTQFSLILPTNKPAGHLNPVQETQKLRTVFNEKNTELSGGTETAKDVKILIAEDNYDYCVYLNTILSDYYDLFFVSSGKEALKSLKKGKYDLLITDWMMPEMNGIDLAKSLREIKELNNIPILMLTAGDLKGNRARALRVGIDDYLEKSFGAENLLSRIDYLLDNKEERELVIENFENSYSAEKYEKNDLWLIELEDVVRESISDFDLNIDALAQKLEYSSQQLSRKIKLITGFTAKKYVQEIRFWEARNLLEIRKYESVKAVCLSVGFKDQKNFSRNFKKRFGKYPSEFLNN